MLMPLSHFGQMAQKINSLEERGRKGLIQSVKGIDDIGRGNLAI